ncbi:hypothetical protein MMC25_000080 [Agyrium rufum]|nr:hypothetical protein [Agyrium rufum]
MAAPEHLPNQSYANAVYYPNYRVYAGKPPSSLELSYITHVIYAFVWPNADGMIAFSDEWADKGIQVDGTKGCLSAVQKLKIAHPHLKTLLSIGGGGAGSTNFAAVAKTPTLRDNFATQVYDLCKQYGFDGVDVDWESPATAEVGGNYLLLIIALRNALPRPQFLLTTALPAGTWALQYIDMTSVAQYLDYINVMAYDFSGPWTPLTGHQAQLYTPSPLNNSDASTSGNSAVQYLLSKHVVSRKILLGVPVYGRSFLGATTVDEKYTGEGGQQGTFDYSTLPRPGTKECVDTKVGAAFCSGGDGGFVTYDNPQTVAQKAAFVKRYSLGGLFYWQGTSDGAGSRSLVQSGFTALR